MADPVGAMPPPDGVTPNFAHPQDVLHTINTVIGILTICLIGPFVLVRLYIRLCITRTFAREDCKSFFGLSVKKMVEASI